MKKTKLLGVSLLLIVALAACKQPEARYTQASGEIETLKIAISDYEAGNWEAFASHYADTAKIFINSDAVSVTPKENSDGLAKGIVSYKSYGFVNDKSTYEMVQTDDKETWVNFWGLWRATIDGLEGNVDMPIHLTAQFIDGKIVKQYSYYNREIVVNKLKELEAAKAEAETSE